MQAKNPLFSGKSLSLLIALIAFLIPFLVPIPGLSEAGHRLFSIFLLAVILWVTEPIPLFATSAVVILFLILFLSDVSAELSWAWGVADGFGEEGPPSHKLYFNSLANRVLILFLGGFFLAFGAARFGVDKNLAAIMLKPFGNKPSRVLLGLMLITGTLSMWMSNTATTATIMAVVIPIINSLKPGDRLRTGLALSVPFAANIGGMGTPIGTPPNAIVLGALSQIDPATGAPLGQCSFLQWMMFAIPLSFALLIVAWLLIQRFFPSSEEGIEIDMTVNWVKTGPAKIYYATALFTILMWVTGSLHGINSYVVGMFPVAILLTTGVVGAREFRGMEWDVLWLVAGGIALGIGVSKTGFDEWIVGLIQWDAISFALLGIAISATALAMGTLISHSAATNLLAPIAVAVAASVDGNAAIILVFLAIGASMAMALPISTPPNAIAYSTGMITTRQMATVGSIIAVIGLVLTYFLLAPLLKLAGVS